MIRKVSAEDVAIRGNGTGLEYMCPTRHFVYIFFNPVFQVSTAKNEINLFNNHVLIVAPVTFAPAGAMTPSAEFLFLSVVFCLILPWNDEGHHVKMCLYGKHTKARDKPVHVKSDQPLLSANRTMWYFRIYPFIVKHLNQILHLCWLILMFSVCIYCNNPKYWNRQAWVNSVDPNQMLQNTVSG